MAMYTPAYGSSGLGNAMRARAACGDVPGEDAAAVVPAAPDPAEFPAEDGWVPPGAAQPPPTVSASSSPTMAVLRRPVTGGQWLTICASFRGRREAACATSRTPRTSPQADTACGSAPARRGR